MPTYINGRPANVARRAPSVSPDEIIRKLTEAITDSGQVGDISRLSKEEMAYLRAALKGIADKTVKRIFMEDIMSGVDIERVVDIYEIFPETGTEEHRALAY